MTKSIQGGNKGHQKRWCMLCRIIKQFQGRNVKDPKSGWRHLWTSQGDKKFSSSYNNLYILRSQLQWPPRLMFVVAATSVRWRGTAGGRQEVFVRCCSPALHAHCLLPAVSTFWQSRGPGALLITNTFVAMGPDGVTPVKNIFLNFFFKNFQKYF